MRRLQAEAGTTLTSSTHRSRVPVVLGAAVLVYLLDRVTKAWVLGHLVPGEPQDFVGSLLRLRLVFNPGAAFSFGTGATPVFTAVMSIVALLIVFFSPRLRSLLWACALGLVLGGALGNLTDRLTRPPGFGWGHVVDFLELPNFPVFNVADSAIVTGAALVALASLRGIPATGPDRRSEAATDPADVEASPRA